jgi:hypothetical protein
VAELAEAPPKASGVRLKLELQHKQGQAFLSQATEILYGGAAFGGKSHLKRVAAITWATEIAGLNVYMFRRVEDDLIKNHMEGPHGFRMMLADWVAAKLVTIVETEIRFNFNGSRIFLCHCKDPNHRYKYHGAEIHVLLVDELTTFLEIIYQYLRFRVRMVGVKFDHEGNYLATYPEKYRKGCVGPDGRTVNPHDLFPRIICGSNPGNIGHHWVKREFIEPVRPMEVWTTPDDAGGMHRQFIPARVADNPIGTKEDPEYVKRMRGLKDPALVKAMEEGDWNVVAGGFFPEFSRSRHMVKPFTVPSKWKRFTATDWGSSKPFSTGWYAIVQDDMQVTGSIGNPVRIKRGSIVRYREWYGCKEGESNVGIKLPIGRWAKGVLHRSRGEEVEYHVVDPSMFIEDGGPSLAEEAMKVRERDRRLTLRPADNKRLPGWDQIRLRLQGDDPENGDDEPTVFMFDTCRELARTLEALQHDETDAEDADTDGEDHAPDELRYACMSRPRKRMEPTDRFAHLPKKGTIDYLTSEAWKNQKMPGITRRPLG